MTKHIILSILLCYLSFPLAAEESYGFRVYLKDKGCGGYSVDAPEAFLSKEAVLRREKRGIPVTAADLPISESYIEALKACGTEPVAQSRWLSTVVVVSRDSSVCSLLKELPMVDSVKWVWKGANTFPAEEKEEGQTQLTPASSPLKSIYGYAESQIKMLRGEKLHGKGFRGEGMRVAVIDAGFRNVDRISVFRATNVIGTRNMVAPGQSVYTSDDHGTKVLSCMAANTPGVMVGTAPEASYLLIKSEDSRSEYPIEEDYWVAAVEYADSMGVDVISSSLGYFTFDAEELSYPHEALDGKTSHISRAAHIAGEKGLLLFSSAGNEGDSPWGRITFPADAQGILTVGAVDEDRKKSIFSSCGPTVDGRMKPDVVAQGSGCCVISPEGEISYANGTSFATPILAGLGACLWQALPHLTSSEIIALLQQSATKAKRHNDGMGYGIPNICKAYKKGKRYAGTKHIHGE